jgi:hypothetical protein
LVAEELPGGFFSYDLELAMKRVAIHAAVGIYGQNKDIVQTLLAVNFCKY